MKVKKFDLRAANARRAGVGPTGKFPRGKMDQHDEGELQIGVTAVPTEGVIRIDFGKLITWVAFPPTVARQIAAALNEKADAVEKGLM